MKSNVILKLLYASLSAPKCTFNLSNYSIEQPYGYHAVHCSDGLVGSHGNRCSDHQGTV